MKQTLQITVLLWLIFSLTSCKVGRFIYYNFADIDDHNIFPSRLIENGDRVFNFKIPGKEKVPKQITYDSQINSFEPFLEENKTVAFLIIQNDTIQYENYWHGYEQGSIVPSFSMAKSVTSMLIGCAIDDGLIDAVEDPITKYIPDLDKNEFGSTSIKQLLNMTSGLEFNESYINPLGDAATFYYGRRLRKSTLNLEIDENKVNRFKYSSGNSQLLGLLLENVLDSKDVSSYLEEKIWKPLGMEYDASWSIDRKNNGLEKTFCCLNARARDYAKLGRLYLNKGNWNGSQIVSQEWVNNSTKVDITDGSAWYYQYQWWLPTDSGDFMAHGILGQYIYVNPQKNLIIVRLGKKEGDVEWEQIFTTLAAAY
ncbi:MAG: serine hydrolase [Nonlabens sp.]